jgi:DNA polymerase-3 subunit delta'
LLCETQPAHRLAPCGRCPACQQAAAGSHPDLDVIAKPADRSFIPLEAFIGDREHRMREGMCHRISLKPYRGGYKIALIEDADYLNEEGANCLLKLLEEPPPKSILILIGASEQRQLPTIRSRCQVIRFRPLPEETVAKWLVARGLVDDPREAAQLAPMAGGSLQRAVALADRGWRKFRGQLLQVISAADWSPQRWAREVAAFVDQAGKDAPPRRAQLRQTIEGTAEFYRQLMRALSGAEIVADEDLRRAIDTTLSWWGGDAEMAAACVDGCWEAEANLDRNANQATLLECWLDDLAQISRAARRCGRSAVAATPQSSAPH